MKDAFSRVHAIGMGTLLGLLLAPSAFAACPLAEYSVTGTVVERAGAPLAGAIIEAEWEEKAAGIASTRARTDVQGRFTLSIQFDPYSSRSIGGTERCEAKLDRIDVRVRAEGFTTVERRVDLGADPVDVSFELR